MKFSQPGTFNCGHLKFLGLCLAAAILTGCGILPAMVQNATQVAMLPVTTAANSLSRDARLMSRTFEYGAARVGRGLEVGAASLGRSAQNLGYSAERAASAVTQATTPPIQFQTSRLARPSARYQANAAPEQPASNVAAAAPPVVIPPPQVDILPATVLSQLTEDQMGLQRAAQSEAFNAPVGEEIYWEVDGRTGSAAAESENKMGSFVCRTFIQTLTLEDGSISEGDAVMCRNDSGAWTGSF
jgi:surface antigen